jgi:methylisocitrate lyase
MAGSKGAGKVIVSAEEMIETRLKPAVNYAKSQEDFMVMARTDAIAVDGFKEAVRRGHQYAENGADMIFIEALESEEQLRQIPKIFKGSGIFTVANIIESSPKTPYKSPRELHEMGYNIGLYPIGSLLIGCAAQRRYYSILGRGEDAMLSADTRPERWFEDFNKVIGREQTETWNRSFNANLTSKEKR